LALASGKLHSSLADDRFIALFQPESELVDAGNLRRSDNI
jgi:hypothetical protein